LSSGAATYTTSSLALGTHFITATYGGDTLFLQSTSTALSQVVVASSITFGANPTTGTIAAGASGKFVITATPTDYSGTVSFACGTLPAHASCAFAPTTLTFASASSAQTSTLTVSTKATTSAALTYAPGKIYAPGILAALLLLPLSFRKRLRKLAAGRGVWTGSLLLLLVMTATVGLLGVTGCGGASGSASTSAGSYTIPVMITAGATTSTLNVNVVVQ
jgi:hypothetical protein